MGSDQFLSNLEGVIEIQDSGSGRGNRGILDLTQDVKAALGDFSVSLGSITRNYRVSPRTNTYVPRPIRRGQPEAITPQLTCKMVAANYMENLDAASRFAVYVRHATANPTLPLNYSRVDILNNVGIESFDYGAFTIDEGDEEDITLTVPMNAAAHLVINPVEGKQIVTGFADADDCNVVAAAVDEDGVIYAVTASDSVDGYPYLVYSDDDGATWTEVGLSDLSADCTAIAVAGDYLIIASSTTIAVYTKAGVLSSSYTASGAVSGLEAIDAANIVAVGAAGLALLSSDGGASWTALTSGTANALSAVKSRSIVDFFMGGASGTLLHYLNGTISTVTLPGGLAAVTINQIAFPDSPAGFERDEDVYIACSNGTVYRSIDDGTNWVQISFPGDDAGAVADIGFTGFLGQVLYVLHTPAAGSSVLWRDWTGGVGGNINMEGVTVPTNSGMNALVVVDPNNAYVFGDVHSAADMVMKVEK